METKDYYLNNKQSYVQILKDEDNLKFREVLNKESIVHTTSTGKGIHFDGKDYKKIKRLLKETF
jgi:hypothetical protein